ncbi:MAG: hypothetical protein F6K00_19765 [Leptolyngbya sp. SIOISBB]|nr:hypothetical protein [Leptolyngbya sp. SIOISBB]
MPRRKGGTVTPHGEIHKRFKRRDIADQVMGLLKYADKTPEQLIIALGINRWDNRAKATQQQELCKEMDALIKRRGLPITKTEAPGRGAQPKYGLSRQRTQRVQAEPTLKTCIDPALKGTWSADQKDAHRDRKKAAWAEKAQLMEADSKAQRADMRKRLQPKSERKTQASTKARKPRTPKPAVAPKPAATGRPRKVSRGPTEAVRMQLEPKILRLLRTQGNVTEAQMRRRLGAAAVEVAKAMTGVDSGQLGVGRFFYLSEEASVS